MQRMESYRDLVHGTDEKTAEIIVKDGFKVCGDATSWCGKGAYFYDIKAKAWWAADRKCNEIKKKSGEKPKHAVVFADIIELPKNNIFDLRIKKDVEAFEKYINEELVEDYRIRIKNEEDEEEIIKLRAMLISFYADQKKYKLVIGDFKQREQELYNHAIEFANSLKLVIGIETIYCVKDTSIISNIRKGGEET